MKIGILKSFKEIDDLIISYANACKLCNVDYEIIDMLDDNWIEIIIQSQCDGFLVREKANISEYKEMYNERLWVVNKYLGYPIYPSYDELFLYENKRMYNYFFKTHNINTPKTHIFYDKSTALRFCKSCTYPLIFKTNGGAGGVGVKKINSKIGAYKYIFDVFGLLDPRLSIGRVPFTSYKNMIPVPKFGMTQRYYVIIQEYIDVDVEWRIIKIGDTFAGYKRPIVNNHASCDLMEYGFPPVKLLQLIKDVAEKNNFDSLSMDVLLSKNGMYYVTEMQSLYGSFSPNQCMVNDESGRIIYKNGDFTFEKGTDFFQLNSNVLRVKDFINKLSSGYYK